MLESTSRMMSCETGDQQGLPWSTSRAGVRDIDRSQLTTTDSSASTTHPPIDFPQGGWSQDSKDAPSVCVGVIRAHLKQREASVRPTVDDREDSAGGEEDHTQKPFDRGFNFFLLELREWCGGGEICSRGGWKGLLSETSRCWASQRKHTNYTQQVIIEPSHGMYMVKVRWAYCIYTPRWHWWWVPACCCLAVHGG